LRRRVLQNLIVTLPQPSNNKFVTIGVYVTVPVFKLITVLKLIEILLADYTKKSVSEKMRSKRIRGGDGLLCHSRPAIDGWERA
jgi:hypothetical protein